MKIILFLTLFTISVYAQIFTDDFSDRVRLNIGSTEVAHFYFDSTYHTVTADLANSNNLTWSGTAATDSLQALNLSPIYEGGNGGYHTSATEYFNIAAPASNLDLTTNWTLVIWTKKLSAADGYWIWHRKATANFDGYAIYNYNTANTIRLLSSNGTAATSKTSTALTAPYPDNGVWHTYTAAFGNTRVQFYADSLTWGSATGANNPIAVNAPFKIGYADASGSNAALILAVRVFSDSLTLKQVKEIRYLANGWESGSGNVFVNISGLKFNQGISGSGLTVKSKATGSGTSFTYTPTLTGDSTRFTYQTGVIHTFNTDSILFATDTDSIWKAVTDTVLASTLGLQVVFDAWETGGVVYIDNITVSGYTLPVSTTTTGKFKDKHKQFKNFIER